MSLSVFVAPLVHIPVGQPGSPVAVPLAGLIPFPFILLATTTTTTNKISTVPAATLGGPTTWQAFYKQSSMESSRSSAQSHS